MNYFSRYNSYAFLKDLYLHGRNEGYDYGDPDETLNENGIPEKAIAEAQKTLDRANLNLVRR